MPRDLESERATLEGMEPLTKDHPQEPAQAGENDSAMDDDPPPLYVRSHSMSDAYKKLQDLHPYSLLLNIDDVDDVDWLEHAAFDSNEAASREKLEYRLTVCGELCTGIFTSAYATASEKLGDLLRSRNFPSVDSADSDRKKVLLGHIVATKANTRLVTDAAMTVPDDWRTNYQISPGVGHDEDGETICLHSLAIHPDFHGRGLGRVLLLGWSQRMRDSGCAKRIALICRERLIPFYEKHGFTVAGPSSCQFGGGCWYDMVLEFDRMPKEDI